MSRKPLVTIVILNWNGADDTIAALESLKAIDYDNVKIWVLDNGSEVPDRERLKAYLGERPEMELELSPTNLGFAAGVNIGLKRSVKLDAKYTLLLNNDVKVDPHFLTALVETAERDGRTAIVGSKIFYYDQPEKLWSTGYDMNYLFPPLSRPVDPDAFANVDEVLGCSLLIRNSILGTVGYFDEAYFAYGEESDFNYRTIRKGYRIKYCPDSVLWHKVSASTGGGFSPFVAYLKMRNKVRFGFKNLPFFYWPTYYLYVLTYFGYWLVKSMLGGNWPRAKALMRGLAQR